MSQVQPRRPDHRDHQDRQDRQERRLVGETLLDERQVAELLRVSVRTLQNWRLIGRGPRFLSLSRRCVRYRQTDVSRYLDQSVRRSTSDPGELRDDA